MSKTVNREHTGYLHFLTLWALSVSQPLLELLANSPGYFIARNITSGEIVIITLVLCFWIPVCFLGFNILARYLCRVALPVILGLQLGILFCALVLQYILLSGLRVPGIVMLSLALAVTVVFLFYYYRTELVPRIMNWMSVALLIVPVNFLFFTPVNSYFESKPDTYPGIFPAAHTSSNRTLPDVVFIVFDELPLTSLLDHSARIDPVRFPGFDALSAEATWYRNASTVGAYTHRSLTGIVTGKLPEYEEISYLPSVKDVPDNLFTWLSSFYNIEGSEHVSQFCPKAVCDYTFPANVTCVALVDLAVIYAHVILPDEYRSGLADTGNRWGNFVETPGFCRNFHPWGDPVIGTGPDRATRFERFINSIRTGDRPALYFIHTGIPHMPWEYLPSGETSSHVNDRYLRHLLQVGFADSLLAKTVTRLKDLDMYDSALIIVTADHGISFLPGTSERSIHDMTDIQEIINVPLLVKYPHQPDGEIDDRNVETIDIIPTLAEVLGLRIPWQTDGISLLNDLDRHNIKRVFDKKGDRFSAPPVFNPVSPGLQYKLELFGSGTTFSELEEKNRQ